MLKNASFLAIVAVHTAENESQQVSSVFAEKMEKIRPYLTSKVRVGDVPQATRPCAARARGRRHHGERRDARMRRRGRVGRRVGAAKESIEMMKWTIEMISPILEISWNVWIFPEFFAGFGKFSSYLINFAIFCNFSRKSDKISSNLSRKMANIAGKNAEFVTKIRNLAKMLNDFLRKF